ncbi:DUF6894 family protein [Microvirga tunisiensis]|uniref:DUF6894 family protein n=1 Tax=Microvirga tunisiensis TaxID=2108360 RepID=UPI003B84AD37
MPLYYFDIREGLRFRPDLTGEAFEDLVSAKGHAVHLAGEIAQKMLSSDTEIYEIRRHPVLRRLKREPAGEPPPDPAGDSCAP